MNILKTIIIISLYLLVSDASAKDKKQTKILINYKYNNLEYVKEVDDDILEGEYNATILYSSKIVKKDIKYEDKIIFTKDKLILQPDDIKRFKIVFDEPLDIAQYSNLEFIYKSLNPFIKFQKFSEYKITFIKDNDLSIVNFINSDLDLDLELDLDLGKAIYEPKDKVYLIKRMFDLEFNDIWRITSIAKLDLIQRRFDKKLTYRDTIEIWTKKNIKLHNIVFMQDEKIDLPISFLNKRTNDEYNIYSLDINKFLTHYFIGQDEVTLKELQIFIDGKFKIGDIQRLRFLHSKVDKRKIKKDYKIEKIVKNKYKHYLDLKKYHAFCIKAIDIKIVNDQKYPLILKDIKSSVFSKMKVDIPIIFNKHFPFEVKTKTYNQLKNISLNKLLQDNYISKRINFKDSNISSNLYINKRDNAIALIKLNSIKDKAFVTIQHRLKNIDDLNASFKVDSQYKLKINNEKIIMTFPEDVFSNRDSIILSDFILNYRDNNLSVQKLLEEDLLFKINKENIYAKNFNNIFDNNEIKLKINTKHIVPNFKINDSKYFNVDSITLIPNFDISKDKFLDLTSKKQDNKIDDSSSEIWKQLKVVFYLALIWLLFRIRRFIWNIISTMLNIKLFIELMLGSNLKNSIFYLIISLLLYGIYIISTGVNVNSMYVSFAGIFLVVGLSYLSLYLQPFVLTKYNAVIRKIYKGNVSINFDWAIVFLIFTVFFVGIGLEPIAEQFAIIVYYLLVWGTIKELINLKRANIE